MEASVSDNGNMLLFTELPTDVIRNILGMLKYGEIARLRLVSKRFNEVCSFLLNAEFNNLQTIVSQRHESIKALMPRRESAKRKHQLIHESQFISSLKNSLTMLNVVFNKYIEKNECCFFPGDIIDEIHTELKCIKYKPFDTSELHDLTSMAIQYFEEEIVPTLEFRRLSTPDSLDSESWSDIQIQLDEKKATNVQLVKLQDQLTKTNEQALQNAQDIVNMRLSMNLVKRKITAVEKELLQINCKAAVSSQNSPVKKEDSFEVKDELVASCSYKSSEELKIPTIQSAAIPESINIQKELPTERKSSKRVATDREEDKLPSKRRWS